MAFWCMLSVDYINAYNNFFGEFAKGKRKHNGSLVCGLNINSIVYEEKYQIALSEGIKRLDETSLFIELHPCFRTWPRSIIIHPCHFQLVWAHLTRCDFPFKSDTDGFFFRVFFWLKTGTRFIFLVSARCLSSAVI